MVRQLFRKMEALQDYFCGIFRMDTHWREPTTTTNTTSLLTFVVRYTTKAPSAINTWEMMETMRYVEQNMFVVIEKDVLAAHFLTMRFSNNRYFSVFEPRRTGRHCLQFY